MKKHPETITLDENDIIEAIKHYLKLTQENEFDVSLFSKRKVVRSNTINPFDNACDNVITATAIKKA